MFCERCVLGLLAQRENRNYELQIPVTVHFGNVAQACCVEKEHGLIHQGNRVHEGMPTLSHHDLCMGDTKTKIISSMEST